MHSQMLPDNNLTPQRARLIGRKRELVAARALLLRDHIGLLTLTGPGGTGKTRLALTLARDLLYEAAFKDGVFFVNLAPVTDPSLVLSHIAQTWDVREIPGQPLLDTLRDYLRDKQMLLLLDNFEQVIEAALDVGQLLLSCPLLKMLVTSREGLQLYGEQIFPVPSLDVPGATGPLPPLEQLAESGAVQLFIERAQAVKPDFALTQENATAIVEICRRLDGLPLALELAAGRIRLLTPNTILARLESRLGLATLAGGPRDIPARQQTLRNTIGWSYDLLNSSEQKLFQRISVFVGGCTLDAVQAVCWSEGEPDEVLEEIGSLMNKSLLRRHRQREGADRETRYWILPTIQEYAGEMLVGSGEAVDISRRHAKYFLGVAEKAEPELVGTQQSAWLQRLESEHDNLRAAFRWSQLSGEAEMALRLAGALSRFWFVRGYYGEGRQWLLSALESAGYSVEVGAASPGEPVAPSALAKALHGLGQLADSQGDYSYARSRLEESLAISRRVGDRQPIAHTLNWLAVSMEHQGEYEEARVFLEESLAICKELDDRSGMGSALNNLGEVARGQGDYDTARGLYEACLSILWGSGTKWQIATALHNLACIACDQDDYGRAEPLFTQSLGFYRDLGLKGGIAACLVGLAGVLGARGQPERAARLFGAAESLHKEIRVLVEPGDRPGYERGVAAARSQMEEAAFEAAWAQGEALALDEVLLLATQKAPDSKRADAAPIPSPQPPTGMVPLTRRETDVLRLLAHGLTNPEIAVHLTLSINTVEAHLRAIYSKLGVNNRNAAAYHAREHNIY